MPPAALPRIHGLARGQDFDAVPFRDLADIDDPLQQAKAARLEGAIRYIVGDTTQTVSILLAAARGLWPHDAHAARDALLQALEAARITGPYTLRGESEVDVAIMSAA